MKVPKELPADLDCEAMEVWKRAWVDEPGIHYHLTFATSGTEQLMIYQLKYLDAGFAYKLLTTKLNFVRNWR